METFKKKNFRSGTFYYNDETAFFRSKKEEYKRYVVYIDVENMKKTYKELHESIKEIETQLKGVS